MHAEQALYVLKFKKEIVFQWRVFQIFLKKIGIDGELTIVTGKEF